MGLSIASRTSYPTSLGFSSAAAPSSSAEGCLWLLYPVVGLLVLGLEFRAPKPLNPICTQLWVCSKGHLNGETFFFGMQVQRTVWPFWRRLLKNYYMRDLGVFQNSGSSFLVVFVPTTSMGFKGRELWPS